MRSRFWRRFSFFSQAAASASVKNAFSPSSRGRSNGVIVRKSHTPCRSGLPSGVRGRADGAEAAVVTTGELDWPATGTGASNAIALTRPPIDVRNRLFIGDLPSLACLLSKMPIHELFGELDALDLQDLSVPFQPPIERHADLPGPRKHFRVLDGGFVGQRIRAARCVALDHMQRVAVEVS